MQEGPLIFLGSLITKSAYVRMLVYIVFRSEAEGNKEVHRTEERAKVLYNRETTCGK